MPDSLHDDQMGRLSAYGSAFNDAVRMLGEDADRLETDLLSQVEGLRTHFGDPAPSAYLQHFIDSLEFIALLVRHRLDIREVHEPGDGDSIHVVICLKCETFPIPPDADVCPTCATSKWFHVTRC